MYLFVNNIIYIIHRQIIHYKCNIILYRSLGARCQVRLGIKFENYIYVSRSTNLLNDTYLGEGGLIRYIISTKMTSQE